MRRVRTGWAVGPPFHIPTAVGGRERIGRHLSVVPPEEEITQLATMELEGETTRESTLENGTATQQVDIAPTDTTVAGRRN